MLAKSSVPLSVKYRVWDMLDGLDQVNKHNLRNGYGVLDVFDGLDQVNRTIAMGIQSVGYVCT